MSLDGKQVKNKANSTGTGKYLNESGEYVSLKTGFFQVAHGEVSFTTPADITADTVFEFELIGAGGGGGTAPAASGGAASGGGGGECGIKRCTGLQPNTSYSCDVGTGGITRVPGFNLSPGGDTSITIGGIIYFAKGGAGGVSAINSPGGAGGSGGNCDINIPGESGADSGPNSTSALCGKGGASGRGWGAGGREVANNVAGENGKNYGGGASAGHGNAQPGGTGANGRIICRWFNQ
jgi:hypothetical protein